MHLENASGPDPYATGAVEPEFVVVAEPVLAVLDAGVVVLPTVAAVGPGELPPHPATRTPLTSSAASGDVRRERTSRFG
jgi:hypothetical protein